MFFDLWTSLTRRVADGFYAAGPSARCCETTGNPAGDAAETRSFGYVDLLDWRRRGRHFRHGDDDYAGAASILRAGHDFGWYVVGGSALRRDRRSTIGGHDRGSGWCADSARCHASSFDRQVSDDRVALLRVRGGRHNCVSRRSGGIVSSPVAHFSTSGVMQPLARNQTWRDAGTAVGPIGAGLLIGIVTPEVMHMVLAAICAVTSLLLMTSSM